MPSDRAALGAFLRSRRDRLTPFQAGIEAFPGMRSSTRICATSPRPPPDTAPRPRTRSSAPIPDCCG
ncbi:hypothetical protein [Streptomyces sp. NBC_01718]|uniref:hypothetical protein n=1 Tax=Streptomyces sp. NBC_01718 TaxID=2975919 RepID=UPI00352CB24F